MLGGRFAHQDIKASSPIRYEGTAGLAFHYLTGGGMALAYPVFFLALQGDMPEVHLVAGLVFGLATVVLPWLVLYPAFGYGFFGARAPVNSRPILSPLVEHAVYGLGIGLALNLAL